MNATWGTERSAVPVSTAQIRSGRYVFEYGDWLFEIDPKIGARITRYEYQGQNILTDSSFHEIYWGSTLWSSPESDWEHPAPGALDRGSYQLEHGLQVPLSLMSEHPAHFNGKSVKARKTFAPDLESGSMVIRYELFNASETNTFSVAPWEVTRVPGGGMCFYPHVAVNKVTDGINLEILGDIAWFDHGKVFPEGQKIWSDGREGWVAHAARGLLHVKEFQDLTPEETAPGEGDVEIYSSGTPDSPRSYVEVEAQGPFALLAPGESVVWQVRWHLIPIPRGLALAAGNEELVRIARSLLTNSCS